jgi:hypothetical protein
MNPNTANLYRWSFSKTGVIEQEISIAEDKLSAYQSVHQSFKTYVERAFESVPLLHSFDCTPDLIIPEYSIIQFKKPKLRKSLLDWNHHLEVLSRKDVANVHEEWAESQIDGFYEFLERRLNRSVYGISDKELRLIAKVRHAIAIYQERNCVYYYNNFRKTVADYFLWIGRKVYKSSLYVLCLRRLLTGSGIVVDVRRLLRVIMRFLCRRLDDEHSVNNKISINFINFFYCQTRFYHEYSIYRTNHTGSWGGLGIRRINN